jgi:hypothetical protein
MGIDGTRTGKKVVVRLGLPAFDKRKDCWVCPTEIQGLRGGAVRLARGDEPFRALLNGIERFRSCFMAQREIFESIRNSPEAIMVSPYFLFPHYVPTRYGADAYQRISDLVQSEIDKIERRWSRRRLKDKRYREIMHCLQPNSRLRLRKP